MSGNFIAASLDNINEIMADMEAHDPTPYPTDTDIAEEEAAVVGYSDDDRDEQSTIYFGSDHNEARPAAEADDAAPDNIDEQSTVYFGSDDDEAKPATESDDDKYTSHLSQNELQNLITAIETGGGTVVDTDTSGNFLIYSYPTNTNFEITINNSTGQVTAYEGDFPLSYNEIKTLIITQIEAQDNINAELQYNDDSRSDGGFPNTPSDESDDYLV